MKLRIVWIFFPVFLIALLIGRTAFSQNAWENWQEKSGPIPIINQNPVQLLFMQPAPGRAEILPKGHGLIRLNTTLTNTLISNESSHYQATVDMEAFRTSLEVDYGIASWLEFSCSLPVSHYYSGFLDSSIYHVESFIGNIRGVRKDEERQSFTYWVKKDGKIILSGSENTTGIGDMTVGFKARLREQGDMGPALSARASVKLPTGHKGKAFGSGKMDWALGLLAEKDIDKLSLYLNGDIISPGNAFEDEGIRLEAFYSLLFGVEYRLVPRFAVISQISHVSRPFEHTGVPVLDRRIYELLLGVSYHSKGGFLVQGGFVEDIIDSTDATADVTLFLNVGMGF